jgi:hypothetical protein
MRKTDKVYNLLIGCCDVWFLDKDCSLCKARYYPSEKTLYVFDAYGKKIYDTKYNNESQLYSFAHSIAEYVSL